MVQSEAQKRAKAKYYQKLKENPEYKEAAAKRTKEYYTNNKDKHMEACKLYYTENKEKLLQYSKDKRKENKIKSVRIVRIYTSEEVFEAKELLYFNKNWHRLRNLPAI